MSWEVILPGKDRVWR